MALPSTTYKIELNLTDMDRSVYENLRFTVARHPSETEERLAARLIAYALFYHEQLAFGRGLSDVDEPALWEKSLDDRVLHWIEVGSRIASALPGARGVPKNSAWWPTVTCACGKPSASIPYAA